MRRVIVESPFAGDIPTNIKYARAAMADCLSRHEAPYASHLLYTQEGVLDDLIPEERELGIKAGFIWGEQAMARCVYLDRGISHGMLRGIEEAHRLGQALEFRSVSGWENISFMVLCREGKVPSNRAREWIGWFVEAWHARQDPPWYPEKTLADFLGMTSEEYSRWIDDPDYVDFLAADA